jgi:hypothetical protein
VHVHYSSSKPAQAQALAYTQGTDIHVGPGQEQHLAHEAWHVVQQKQGRVEPTLQANGATINDDPTLEAKANQMGLQAVNKQIPMQAKMTMTAIPGRSDISVAPYSSGQDTIQRMIATGKLGLAGLKQPTGYEPVSLQAT